MRNTIVNNITVINTLVMQVVIKKYIIMLLMYYVSIKLEDLIRS